MFSKLDQLEKQDIIYVSDLLQHRVVYEIYDKYTSEEDDMSCTAGSNSMEITLITCNKNNNNKRVVIKAKTKEQ